MSFFNPSFFRPFKGFKDVLGFFTIIPVRSGDFEGAADHAYWLPAVGALIAGIASVFAALSFYLLPPSLTGIIVLLVSLLITGFNNIDGLADFADGMMAHGNLERKRSAMKDTGIGISGLVSCIFVIGIAASVLMELSILGFSSLIKAIFVSEIGAKYAMLLISYVGRPAFEGLGSAFLERVKGPQIVIGSIIAIILLLPAGPVSLTALIVIPTVFTILVLADRNFGGISGDVIGACGELSRTAILLGVIALFYDLQRV
ncbi:MAG: cobalamin-5-phosphate synthase [Candidatus Syntrophoarchaeum butanivorans]|uniref:Adenosylcobinamide-GDP ribazoletransferase n=3 Tax=Candidatus Syntropharchaeum butanivorans TaxID=1839936 RepID=A0A1F2P582_9EURY|nr:MAG: cobalamin-5-phosphate synthase [Candidatus Syntrophoarchaeum butanivorans]